MDNNLKIFTEEVNRLQGQFVLCDNVVYRLIGLADDTEDYYYVLYNGRKLKLTTCLMRITPLKGYILEDHYNEIIRMARLNHYDQPTLYGTKEDISEFNEEHKNELIGGWSDDTKFIIGPFWEIN